MDWKIIVEWVLRILSIGILVIGFLREYAKNAKTKRGLGVTQDILTGAREILHEMFPNVSPASGIAADKPAEEPKKEESKEELNKEDEPAPKTFKETCKKVYEIMSNIDKNAESTEITLSAQIISALATGYYYIYKEAINEPEEKSESAEGVTQE